MTDARVRRGRRSEEIAARYLRPVYPAAVAVAASLPGRDILNTAPFAPEVKARKGFEPIRAMQQAERNAGDDIPMVVLRMDGQGEEGVGEWLCLFRFKHARELMEVYGTARDGGTTKQPTAQERTKAPGHSYLVRVGSHADYPSYATLEISLCALLYAMGFESGDYDVEVRRRKGGNSKAA